MHLAVALVAQTIWIAVAMLNSHNLMKLQKAKHRYFPRMLLYFMGNISEGIHAKGEKMNTELNNVTNEIDTYEIDEHDKFPFELKDGFWKKLREDAVKYRVPIHGHFEITPFCMLDCKMCYVHLSNSQVDNKQLLTLDEWKRIIDDAIDNGMMFASLTGGECLMSPHFDELYSYLKSKGIMVTVLTNGVLLDRKIELFKKYKPNSIQISMYGWDEDSFERVTGFRHYEKVKSAIETVIDMGINVSIAITPSKYLLDVNKIAEKYVDKNVSIFVSSWIMPPRESTGRVIDDICLTPEQQVKIAMDFYNLTEKTKLTPYTGTLPLANTIPSKKTHIGLKCAAGRTDFSISWKGEMTLCASLDDVIGYPLQESFSDIWKKCVEKADHYAYPVECADCQYNSICKPCPAQHLIYGDGKHCNPDVCKELQMKVRCGLKKFNKESEEI